MYRDIAPSEWKWRGYTVHMVTEPLDVQGLLKDSIDGDSKWNELPPKISIGHVHLHVSNLAKAKKFYHVILGLNHTATFPGEYFFAANRYHHHVATNTWLGENISSAINNNRLGLGHYSINLHSQNEILSMKITGPTLFFSFIEVLLEHIHFYI